MSFQVEPGERVLIAGPSGAGKSTLALCLAGLIPTSIDADVEGEVEVDGRPTASYPPGALAAHVGALFQDPSSQFTLLTVGDEVAFGLENLRVPTDEMPERVADALRAVGLEDRAGWRLDRLSGGQQQRVALAAALATRPDTLVLDEPTAHLDPANGERLYAAVRAIADQRGTTLAVVEHDLDAVVPHVVDRCLLLDASGALVADDAVRRLFGPAARAAEWERLGVWLPSSVSLALALGLTGDEALPVGEAEAAAWMAARPDVQARLRQAGQQAARRDVGEPVLEARGVSVDYRAPAGLLRILHDVDLTVHAGELVAVVGASGGGKTTLLRALSGLLPLAGGSVRVDDVDLRRATPRQAARLISHVFQNPESGFVADTVEDELAYGPRALAWPDAQVRQHVGEALERYGLAALARANPFTLSQGQKRRLSVAASLILGPHALVLDEPTFGQDRRSAQALMDEIGALRARGLAVLVATHDLGLVLETADRVVVLADGRVRFDGPVEALLACPEVLEAAGQRPPALPRILQQARALGANVPASLRRRDLAPEVLPA